MLGEAAGGSWGFHRLATPVGIAVHVAAVLALGVLAAFLATRSRSLRAIGASVIVSLGAGIVHFVLLGREADSSRALTVPQLIIVYMLLAAGLVVGMRLARTGLRIE